MKARNIIGTALLALAFMLAATPALAHAQIEIGYFNDFQKSLDKFLPGSSLDSCVTKDTLKLSFEKTAAKMGLPTKYNGYAELTRDCGNPVWMMINLTGSGNDLLIQFDAKDVENCGACIPLVYAGTSAPKDLSQFKADYTGLDVKWQKHTVRVSLAPPTAAAAKGKQAGAVIAIAFTNLDDSQVRLQRMGIDNLSVMLDAGTAPPESN